MAQQSGPAMVLPDPKGRGRNTAHWSHGVPGQIVGAGEQGLIAVYDDVNDSWTTLASGGSTYSSAAFDSDGTLYVTFGTTLASVSTTGVLTTVTSALSGQCEGVVVDSTTDTAYVACRTSASISSVDLSSGNIGAFTPPGSHVLDTGWYPTGMLMGNNGYFALLTGEFDLNSSVVPPEIEAYWVW